jgi:DNA repair protein RecO (recombination protein O)
MHSYKIEGIVLKRINLGESDRIVTLFTRDLGKVAVVARGVRKSTSKRAGSLEPFSLIQANVIVGKGNLDTLAEVKLIKGDYVWQKYLGRITLAYQLCEIVDKLTPDNQPHIEIFEILKNAMVNIGKLDQNWKLSIEEWIVNILCEMGYWSENKKFEGDIYEYLETITERPVNSAKLFSKISMLEYKK